MSKSSINDVMRGMISKIRETTPSDVFQSLIENLKKVENNFCNTRSIPVSQAEDALTYFEQQNQNLVLENYKVDTLDDDEEIVFHEKKKSSAKKSRKEKPASRNADLFFSKSEISNDGSNDTNRFDKYNSDCVMKDEYDIGETSDQLEIVENFFERTLSLSLSEIPSEIKPDLRTPTSIQQQIARNEKLLETILNTSSVTKAECISRENSNQASSELIDVDLPPIRLESTTLFQSQEVSEKLGKSEVPQQLLLHTEELNRSTTQPAVSSVTEKLIIDMFYNNFVKKQNQLMSGTEAALVHNFNDVFWTEIKVPFSPYWICVSDIGIFCGVEKLEIWRSLTKLPPLQWIKESCRSLRMSISQSGNIRWKLDFGVAYAYLAANNSVHWHMTARNVESIAVNETSAWYLCDGLVYVQQGLTPTKPFSENPVEIHCVCKMSKLACFDNNLWALSTNGNIWNRENITEDNPHGSIWRKIFKPDSIIIANIALTCRKIGWIIDKLNNIYFCDNYNSNKADWWQVIIRRHNYIIDGSSSNYFSKSIHHVRDRLTVIGSDRSSIWISSGVDNSIYVNKTAVLGHRWIPLPVEELTAGLKWKLLAAAYGTECADGIWCLSNNNHLYFYQSSMNNIRAVEAPTTNNIVYLTATSDLLWVLTNSGEVFISKGISEEALSGTSWEQFHLKHKENTFFKQLSLGTDIIWALNSNDEVYAVVCNPGLINSDSELDWTLIENSANFNITFIDIVVGPNKYMVWALDCKHNIFVREGIFDEVPFGTSWVYVPGIQAVELTISSFAVWALTADGFIYRRCGISCQNYIGDYWVLIPGSLSLITASHSENVWGVCRTSGQLQKYTNYILNLNESFIRSRQYSENLDDEWEIIESVSTHNILVDKQNLR